MAEIFETSTRRNEIMKTTYEIANKFQLIHTQEFVEMAEFIQQDSISSLSTKILEALSLVRGENAELLEDKKRLDWLEKHPCIFVELEAEDWLDIDCEEGELILCEWAGNINDRYKVFLGKGITLRTAIDSAIQGK